MDTVTVIHNFEISLRPVSCTILEFRWDRWCVYTNDWGLKNLISILRVSTSKVDTMVTYLSFVAAAGSRTRLNCWNHSHPVAEFDKLLSSVTHFQASTMQRFPAIQISPDDHRYNYVRTILIICSNTHSSNMAPNSFHFVRYLKMIFHSRKLLRSLTILSRLLYDDLDISLVRDAENYVWILLPKSLPLPTLDSEWLQFPSFVLPGNKRYGGNVAHRTFWSICPGYSLLAGTPHGFEPEPHVRCPRRLSSVVWFTKYSNE